MIICECVRSYISRVGLTSDLDTVVTVLVSLLWFVVSLEVDVEQMMFLILLWFWLFKAFSYI